MASSHALSSTSEAASRSGLTRRPTAAASSRPPSAHLRAPPLHPDIEPSPKPRPVFQLLAFGLILFFACLQFLPPTHFRDPADPLRSWIPFDAAASSSSVSRDLDDAVTPSSRSYQIPEKEIVNVASWISCLDLRVLAVLLNSTLMASRAPEHVHFHFFVPEQEDEKLIYYKLKVLFPHSNIDIIGEKKIKESLSSTSEGSDLWPVLPEVAPFLIARTHPSLRKFIYVTPVTMIKGSIEELFAINLRHHSIAAVEDCSKSLGDYVNIQIVNAIQRTAAKDWVSKEPYNESACIPDLSVLLLDASKIDKNLYEAIVWWQKVLHVEVKRGGGIVPSAALAISNRFLRLPTSWRLRNRDSELPIDANVARFDGNLRICSENQEEQRSSSFGNSWQQYVSRKSELVLEH